MQLSSLKNQLIEAYSPENLNEITTKIIAYNRQKNSAALKALASIINDFIPFNAEKESRLFARLMMLYHPDKLKEYQQSIITADDAQSLQELMHIVQVHEQIDVVGHLQSYRPTLSPEAFEEEYGWSYQSTDSDYYVIREDDETITHLFDEENPEGYTYDPNAPAMDESSFLGAVKRKIYGPMSIQFPVDLLEDMEDIEMAEYDIENLDGVEYCTYVKILDLSHNRLQDLHKLENCEYIQELYLTDNQLYNIDGLHSMQDLRVLDLSHNQISNITVLYNLPCLEFVNLLNNRVSPIQIEYLSEKGIVVVC